MIKSLLALIFLFPFLAYSNPVLDRQESMRDFNKLMRAANNLIKDDVINDDLAGIYEEIENIITKNIYPADKQDLKVDDDKSSALGAMGLKPKIVH